MQIIVKSLDGVQYQGQLVVDGEVIDTVLQPRIGCAARALLNRLMLQYGAPDEDLTLDISGW